MVVSPREVHENTLSLRRFSLQLDLREQNESRVMIRVDGPRYWKQHTCAKKSLIATSIRIAAQCERVACAAQWPLQTKEYKRYSPRIGSILPTLTLKKISWVSYR